MRPGIVALVASLMPSAFAQAPPNLADLINAHPDRPRYAAGQQRGQEVSYASGAYSLKGAIHKPQGNGPFPAILWNHGSNENPGPQPELAAFYNSHGFVFFTPVRRGHSGQPGEYIVARNEKFFAEHPGNPQEAWKHMVPLHDEYNADVEAALRWLKQQPYVDPARIIMSGVSYGGIQTLISAEKGTGVRGFISFAPGAMSWRMTPLRERLARAVKNAKAPLFLLQASNDFSTGPVDDLGPAIRKKGSPNQAKLYPAFGPPDDHAKGHASFSTWNVGTQVWGADVMAFIRAVLAP